MRVADASTATTTSGAPGGTGTSTTGCSSWHGPFRGCGATDGLGRDRVLASAVRLLELGLFRVGGEPYVEENGSYGLATLCKRHVRAVGDELRFD